MTSRQQSALITGAASGLGSACVGHFSQRGLHVVAVDLRGADQAEQSGTGPDVLWLSGDVTSADDMQRAIQEASRSTDGLRLLVHCAGILHAGRTVSRHGPADLDQFAHVIYVNLVGTFNVARLAAQAMLNNEPDEQGQRGVMILTSSVAAFEGQIGQAAYSASKGGVAAMTLPLAREFGPQGIRVVAIAPGVFETPMMAAAPEAVRQSLLEQAVFPHRFGRPEEFAACAGHIYDNVMLNGLVLRLDGGIRMNMR